MSSEVEWGNSTIWEKKPSYSFDEMADQAYDLENKANKASAYVEGVVGAYDRRNDDVFKATGEKLFNPLRDIPSNDDLTEMQTAYREMVGGGTVDKSRTTFQQEWFAAKYEKRLKELAERHPQHMPVIKADRSPILDYAEIAQAAERKSADMNERLGMVDVRQSMPSLKNVPVIPDIANLTANLATNTTATVAQFWGGLKADMSDPFEASLNLMGFGAGRASMSVLKTALRNAGANAALEAAAQPIRQTNRKDLGLEYGLDRFFADVGGAAATGFLLDAGVRGPYRLVIPRVGRDVPEGQAFSKRGRGGLFQDAIPQTEPIKPIVREQITPDEIERAKANDIDAIESIARKTGALEDPGVKGAINYAKLTGTIDDAMVDRFKAMGLDHGEGMGLLKTAIDLGGRGYARMPDPIPEARAPLDTAGAAELAPRLAEIEQRLADVPQEVRQAVRAGVEIGAPEIIKAARAALSGDLEGMRAAIAEAGGETVMMDRVTVHTSANPIAVARALRRSPEVMDSNVPMRTEFMRTARAVAALDDAAFNMVLRGQAHPKAGELVANMAPPGQHAEVLRSIEGFRDIAEAKEAIPDIIREGTAEPDNRVKVSDPSGPEAKAQVDALEKAHAKEVEAATAPARKREELESKVETLKGEIAKLEEKAAAVAPDPTLQRKRDLLAKIEADIAKRDQEYAFLSDYQTNRKAIEKKYRSRESYDRAIERLSIDNGDRARADALRAEIAKLEEQQGKMFAIADRGKASLDETTLSPPEQKLLAKLTERTGLKPDDIAEQRAQGQSFGKKIDAALDKATKFEGAEKAADELATKRQELRAAERELEQVQLDQARTLQDPALFNAVMRRAALQRQLDVRRAIDDALRLGDRMLPEGTRVEVRTDEMVDPTSGYRLDASSDMATGDIALASYALNPAGRIGHEGVHTLITKGHIAPEEVKLLAKMARERGLFKDEAKYREAYAGRDNLVALINEEAAAHAIEARINGTDIGPANTMADRIKQLIERIKNALDGYGFKTADDVARAIIEGRAAEREARAEWMRGEVRQKMQEAAERGVTLPDGTQIKGVPLYAIRAYHGSPHDFDKFDLSKIGSGEGAQAYGHGLYFAENEGVAKFYRDQLAPELRKIKDTADPYSALPDAEAISKLELAARRAELNGRKSEAKDYKDASDWIKSGRSSDFSAGRMYEVNIKADPNDFLDWDKPLSQDVWARARQAIQSGSLPQELKMSIPDAAPDAPLSRLAGTLGLDFPQTSNALRDAGIPGIRYLDQGSRGAGEGSRNYVVFDDSLIEIVAKDGKPVDREQMFALADADAGRSMRADLDRLGYYSKALEAAKSLKQAKGTPEQMLAQLKAAGVKDAEIEATNLRSFLDGKKSITRDDLVKHLTENRVGVNEKQYGYKQDGWIVDPLQWGAQGETKRFASQAEAEAYAQSIGLTREHAEEMAAKGKWQNYSLDPSNPTYRETVLHLPESADAASRRVIAAETEAKNYIRRAGKDPDDYGYAMPEDFVTLAVEQFGMPRPVNFEADVRAVSELTKASSDKNFRSGHFSEPNIIGHMMTSLNKHEGRPVFTLDQIQSDWGQKLRDGGVRDEAKIAELTRLWNAANDEVEKAYDSVVSKNTAEPDSNKWDWSEWKKADAKEKLLRAEYLTAKASVSGHPLVNTTDQWTTTTLRRALRQAAEADAEFIAIPSGDTVLSYNPGDDAGMKGFYGSRTSEGIVPKNLRKLLEKIDKEAGKPTKVETLEATDGQRGWKTDTEYKFDKSQTGFTLFPLTDKVKRSVMEEGQAMFALSRDSLDMSPEARKARAEQMGFDTSRVYYHGTAKDFEAFDLSQFGSNTLTQKETPAIFFASSGKVASGYAEGWGAQARDGANVRPVYLKTSNLDEWDLGGGALKPELLKQAIAEAKADGRDGVIFRRALDMARQVAPGGEASRNAPDIIAIFDPTNIRSVNAEFDPAQAGSARLMAAFSDNTTPDPLKSDMAVVDRMSSLRELIEACR